MSFLRILSRAHRSLSAIVVAVFGIAVLASGSHAQTQANARFVAEVTVSAQFDQSMDGMRKRLPEMMDSMQKQFEVTLGDSAASIARRNEIQSKIQPLIDRMFDQFVVELRKPAIRNELISVIEAAYTRTFTVPEIDAMAAYYRSPLGASAMSKMGLALADMAPAVHTAILKAVEPAMVELMDSVKKLYPVAAPK